MLHLESDKDSLNIYFKDYWIAHHSRKNPLITLGIGDGYFKDNHSAFKITDKVRSKFPLPNSEVNESNENLVIITLSNRDSSIQMHVSFQVFLGNLQITFAFEKSEDKPKFNRFWFKLHATSEEAIYGCGEQFSELNLRGLKVPLWVQEQGLGRAVNMKKESSPLYKKKRKFPKLSLFKDRIITSVLNIAAGVGGSWHTTYFPQPIFISSANYFCHINQSSNAVINFKNVDYHEIYFWDVPNSIIIGKFGTALETVGKLSELIGRQPKLPEWAFNGMWLAIQGEGGTSKVEERLKKALDAGVKVSAIWSQDWEGIYETKFGTQLFWDWKWNGGGRPIRFENFPNFVKTIREKYGIRYLGYINSFFNKSGDLYKEGKEKGYFIKDKDGKECNVYITTFPVPIVDLTNPAAFEWVKNIIKKNMIEEAGLSGWMSDYGESVPPDCILYSKESGWSYHNRFPVEWQRANFEAVKEAGKLGEIVYFTRSGYSGTSYYSTMVWAGDQLVNWGRDDGLASVIPAALSLGMTGIGYHHSDIGGFTTFPPFFKRTEELFMRWAEQCAFTMLMRTHESNKPLINPQFDVNDEVLNHLAKMTQIHVHLKPYLQKISEEYQKNGFPPLRPLYLHYEKDKQVHSIQYEYLLGRDLLVAPVLLKKKSTWKVYFPNNPQNTDSWIHIWTGKSYSSGWHEIPAPIGEPPIFYLEGCEMKELFEGITNL